MDDADFWFLMAEKVNDVYLNTFQHLTIKTVLETESVVPRHFLGTVFSEPKAGPVDTGIFPPLGPLP